MTEVIHDPPNQLLSIDAIWLYISSDETGEGVMGYTTPGGTLMPLMAADETRLKSITPIAQKIATLTKKKVKLVKFTMREEIEEFHPEKP